MNFFLIAAATNEEGWFTVGPVRCTGHTPLKPAAYEPE